MVHDERYRPIAVDLDGTLLRSDGLISERTRRALALAEAHGLRVLAVTARPPRRVRKIAAQVGWRGTAICSNGALVYDLATDSVVSQQRLSAEVARALITSARGCPRRRVRGRSRPRVRLRARVQHSTGAPGRRSRSGDAPANRRAAMQRGRDQADRQTRDHQLRAPVRTRAGTRGDARLCHTPGSEFVEVSAAGATKAGALARYCEQHGIAPAHVLAFGDMPNDLPMLGWAGRSVAVANAHEDVMACVHEVTSSNDQEGVARVLERLSEVAFRI